MDLYLDQGNIKQPYKFNQSYFSFNGFSLLIVVKKTMYLLYLLIYIFLKNELHHYTYSLARFCAYILDCSFL